MSDLLNKLSSYNIFNYLLPGVLFVVLVDVFTAYSFEQENIIIGAFVYYFIGMVISRLGSLLVEPFLKLITFVRFAPYAEFVKASAVDPKLEVLSEANNTYRTFCALFLAVIAIKSYEFLEQSCPVLQGSGLYFILGALLLMFLFSYRKQTAYITKRINSHV